MNSTLIIDQGEEYRSHLSFMLFLGCIYLVPASLKLGYYIYHQSEDLILIIGGIIALIFCILIIIIDFLKKGHQIYIDSEIIKDHRGNIYTFDDMKQLQIIKDQYKSGDWPELTFKIEGKKNAKFSIYSGNVQEVLSLLKEIFPDFSEFRYKTEEEYTLRK
ncbi:MAG: hypothetical protein INQ03_03590 [Candidatus Heimdallarchaeota archaeon]|nr:hypothetical protein [Candidatus Heimdallarchaeota archaeon]